MLNLSTPVENIPKIGSVYKKRLKNLGIKTARGILFHLPSRYEDFSNIILISKAKQKLGENICIKGKITKIKAIRIFRSRLNLAEVIVEDDTGQIKAIWFGQPYLTKTLKEDDFVCLAGKISKGKKDVYLANPSYEKITDSFDDSIHTGRIIPIYPETRGITSRWLRSAIKSLLVKFADDIQESLPAQIIKENNFLPINKSLWQIHFPNSLKEAKMAKERFSFEELFFIQLSVLKERIKLMEKKSPPCEMNVSLMKEFTESLPFQLTDSQKKCSFIILKDLGKPVPMSRLLQGDVGSGKTVVATMAALNVAKDDYPASAKASADKQVAFMAPTEILARQHFREISKLLGNFDLCVGLLTAKENSINRDKEITKVSRKKLLEKLKSGEINILIGTHALISKGIEFKNLALVVLDEQHRFGVNQRAALIKNKSLVPHLLSMTATPIPRTLALTVYGDLDLSLITEMPKNRKKVKTFIVESNKRKSAYGFIRKEAKEGKGVFVICPKIEIKNSTSPTGGSKPEVQNNKSSVWDDVKAVKEEYEKLSKEIFPDLEIAMLHGKLKPKEKEKIMIDFKDGKTDILVSTSVVEVGVDVPRATIMMIEGAERFGLAQLHQFRGRVGRSDMQSYCFLFTTLPNQVNRKRLKALVELDNGFELAQKDLEIRGPGQLYGLSQWGLPDIAMESLSNLNLVEKTREYAKKILEESPDLTKYPVLRERLKDFQTTIHFE